MASDGIKIVKEALEKGFASKRAKFFSFAEKSDYKNFIRLFVISDFFRRKSEKERLGEVLSMLENNGAKNVRERISLCRNTRGDRRQEARHPQSRSTATRP